MRLNKWLMITVAATAIGTTGTETIMPLPIMAKTKTTLTSFPKSIRGTWYQRAVGKNYHAVRFTAKKFSWRANVATRLGSAVKIHAHKMPFSGSKTSQHTWIYAVKKRGFTKVGYWNSTVTLELGGYYKLASRRYHGKKVKMLKRTTNLKGQRQYDYFYPNKKMANYFKTK